METHPPNIELRRKKMKTLFKMGVLVVVIGVVVGALVFPDKLALYAGTGKRFIEEKIDEAQSMETKLALLETKVAGLDDEIVRLKEEVIRRKVDVESIEGMIESKSAAHERLRRGLERASELLAEGKGEYDICGRIYSREEVSRDAADKLRIFKIQSETLRNLQTTLETKLRTLEMAEANVDRGESVKTELVAKLRCLQADVEKYKAKQIYAETLNTDDSTAELNTELGLTQKMIAEFEKKLQVKDRILDEKIRVNNDYIGGIDYESPAVIYYEEGDISVEIKAMLRNDGVAKRDN